MVWLYQNITNTLVFTIVFWIHYKFLIALPIWLKICRSVFSLLKKLNLHARKCKCSEVLCAQARPIGIRHPVCPSLISIFIFICHQKLNGEYLSFEGGCLNFTWNLYSNHPFNTSSVLLDWWITTRASP